VQSGGVSDTGVQQDGRLVEPDGKSKERGGSAVALDVEVEIIDRQAGRVRSGLGRADHLPDKFDQAYGIAVDSKDNVYIAENAAKQFKRCSLLVADKQAFRGAIEP
jgi:hypothetical protein